jgi:hypothetical protein
MSKKVLGIGLMTCAATLIVADFAYAQTPATPRRGEAVATRPRPEIDPLGIRLGSFFLYPKLVVEEVYNDNIFATENDTEDDFITVIAPEVSLESNWTRHALNFATGLQKAFYADNDDEDYLDYFASFDGRIDVTRDIGLTGGTAYARRHEDRSDPNDADGEEPTEFDQIDSFLEYDHRFGRFRTTVDGSFRRLDFDDVKGGINNDDRDRNIYGGGLRLGYEVARQYEAFVRGEGNVREYDETPDDAGRDRDSHGYQVVGGVALDLGGLLFGDVFVGYLDQTFPDANEDDVSGFTFGGVLDWNVTPITTITTRVTRDVRETTEDDASAYLSTLGGVTVDHELLRNLILSATASITHNDYEGSGREDLVYAAGAGARYLMNRYFYVTLGYRFLRRSSEDAPGDGGPGEDPDFTENTIRIALQGQF